MWNTDGVDKIFVRVAEMWIYFSKSNHRVHGVQVSLTFLVHLKVIQQNGLQYLFTVHIFEICLVIAATVIPLFNSNLHHTIRNSLSNKSECLKRK